EGSKIRWDPWVAEGPCERHGRKATIKDIHSALTKVGGIEEMALTVGRQGQPLIDCVRVGHHSDRRHGWWEIGRWRPGSDHTVFRREDEPARIGGPVDRIGGLEICRAVEDDPGRTPPWNCHDQRLLVARAVI